MQRVLINSDLSLSLLRNPPREVHFSPVKNEDFTPEEYLAFDKLSDEYHQFEDAQFDHCSRILRGGTSFKETSWWHDTGSLDSDEEEAIIRSTFTKQCPNS